MLTQLWKATRHTKRPEPRSNGGSSSSQQRRLWRNTATDSQSADAVAGATADHSGPARSRNGHTSKIIGRASIATLWWLEDVGRMRNQPAAEAATLPAATAAPPPKRAACGANSRQVDGVRIATGDSAVPAQYPPRSKSTTTPRVASSSQRTPHHRPHANGCGTSHLALRQTNTCPKFAIVLYMPPPIVDVLTRNMREVEVVQQTPQQATVSLQHHR